MMAHSVAVHALGMGEIEVHSALNEPLKAQIKLLSVTAGELSALQVALASNEAFSRMGIDPVPALRDLHFKVVTEGAGAPYISIVSDVPIREPFLDLILMANWSNGQLMREYTLLLDPPVFDEGEAAAPVMAARTEPAAIDRARQPKVAPAPVAVAPVSTKALAASYGPTRRNDTLWSVARDMRPDSSVSIPQMMMALLKENPEAFAKGNINNLKMGYILRAPSLEVINSISSAEAVAEANRQYQEWQVAMGKSSVVNRRQRVAAGTAPEKAAGQAAPAAAVAAESGARLKLLSPEETKQAGGAGSSAQGKGTTTEQLAMALETVEATKQENAELKTRLTDLERQLQAVQRLLTLKGDTLGALQAGLGDQGVVADQQPAPDAAETPAPSEEQKLDQTAEEAVVAEAPLSEEEIAESPVSEEKPAAEVEPAPVVPEVQPETVAGISLFDEVMANPVLLGAAGGSALLLLLLMIIRRRRQQAELEEFDSFAGSMVQMQDEHEPMMGMAGAGVAAKSAFAEEETFGSMVDDSHYGSASMGGAIQAEENEIDPIAEADVYLAYRRYEQAEALLKEAIRNNDNRNELKLKLLEIYFTTKDKDAFEAQAEGLYASLGGKEDELWAQAVEMGREISPEHPLFAEASGVTAPGASAAASAGVAAAVSGAATAEKFNLDEVASPDLDEFSFDLSDEDLAGSLNIPSSEESEIGSSGVFDLDMAEGELESLSSLDETDFSASGELEELSVADEFSLDDDLAAMNEGEELDLSALDKFDADSAVTDAFSLDDNLAGGNGLGDFDSGFDELTATVDLDELGGLDNDVLAQNSATSASDEWTIAPAISSFDAHGVKDEMDDGYVPITNVAAAASGDDLNHLSIDDSDLDLGGDLEGNIFDGSDDIVGTKLDLARAYIDMGDRRGARSILDEVVKEGDDSHRQEAEQLMRQIS